MLKVNWEKERASALFCPKNNILILEEMNHYKTIEILLVEDNPNDIELTRRALGKHNLLSKVHVVKDGEEALDYIHCRNKYQGRDKSDLPKMVLLDLKLPKVDGMEVLREIRSNKNTQYLPVVVLTTSKSESDVRESYRLGINSYIVKPVDYTKFVDAVAQIGLYWLMMNEFPK